MGTCRVQSGEVREGEDMVCVTGICPQSLDQTFRMDSMEREKVKPAALHTLFSGILFTGWRGDVGGRDQ